MKPFLLLQIRPIDAASDNEYESFLKYGQLEEDGLVRIRMEQTGLPEVDLQDYSAVIVGGGPANVSDSIDQKSSAQKIYEADLVELFDQIIEQDFPFLGACYGLGVISNYLQCKVSKNKYFEKVGPIKIKLSEDGLTDELTKDLPDEFYCLGGHKESCIELPSDAVLLASSKLCPIQMIRIKKNIYATQFHPELDQIGFALRVKIYKDAGYFPPEDVDRIINRAANYHISVPQIILERFVQKYKQ